MDMKGGHELQPANALDLEWSPRSFCGRVQ